MLFLSTFIWMYNYTNTLFSILSSTHSLSLDKFYVRLTKYSEPYMIFIQLSTVVEKKILKKECCKLAHLPLNRSLFDLFTQIIERWMEFYIYQLENRAMHGATKLINSDNLLTNFLMIKQSWIQFNLWGVMKKHPIFSNTTYISI